MPALPLVIAVEGISGSGKSTLVAKASPAFGWVPLAEAYDRLSPRPRLDIRSPSALARVERLLFDEEARRWRAARALVAGGSTVLADTGFLGPLTYSAGLVALGAAPRSLVRDLARLARRRATAGTWGFPDAIVWVGASAPVRRRRANRDPVRHPPRLADRHERVGRFEERFYTGAFPAAFPGRLLRLDGDRPADAVVAALGRAVRRVAPLSAAGSSVRQALDGLEELALPSSRALSGNR
jgi:hypothetical protein